MRIVGEIPIEPARLEALERDVRTHRITEHIIRALPGMDAQLAEVVEQDEFTLDLVVRLPDGLFLVYDTT
ncbi:MAG: hypothetical protein H6736_22570 [Alphaproteobacteria bacterium]|nr:hypothetical protein [Alphaproteobacteria bacterium]MCB9694604.1 hypothetical protein [Alphaproteobacteria bacterium]